MHLSLIGDLRKAAALESGAHLDFARAFTELAIARLRLRHVSLDSMVGDEAAAPSQAPLSIEQGALIDRIAFALPRVSARVPWRATCLVQALAARRWLARSGIASQITLGARKSGQEGIEAHAWLTAGGRIVVGGQQSEGYTPFSREQMRDQ